MIEQRGKSEMQATPVISIVMPTYNAVTFIDRAIASVRAQTLDSYELVIVDDCSTDGTFEHVRRLAQDDPKIRVSRLAANSGPSTARNTGIRQATGKWVCFLDADDAFEPARLSVMATALKDNSLQLLADNLKLYDMHAEKVGAVAFDFPAGKLVPLDFAQLLRLDRIGNPRPLGWMKPMIDREMLIAERIFFPEDIRYGEDFLFFCDVLLHRPKAAVLPSAFYIYTTRTGFFSKQSSTQTRTNNNMQSFAKSMRRFLASASGKMRDPEIRLFERRIRDAENFDSYSQLHSWLREKSYVLALGIAIKRPLAVKLFLRKAIWSFRLRQLTKRTLKNGE